MKSFRKESSGQIHLKKIVEGTSGSTGQAFFNALVKNLSEVLDAYGVWVTEYLPEDNKLRALAFYLNGDFVQEYEYKVHGTPCEPVINSETICHFPENVVDLFPEDPDLEPFGAVSYMGFALRDEKNQVLGHLALLDDKPMRELPETFAIFKIFASRAAAELRRRSVDLFLQEQEGKLNRLINGTSELILEFDDQYKITQINKALADILNDSKRNAIGSDLNRFLDQPSQSKIDQAAKQLDLGLAASPLWITDILHLLLNKNEKLPVEATLSNYQFKQTQYFALLMRNVKEKLANEKKLRRLDKEAVILRERLQNLEFKDIIGESEAIQMIKKQINMVAQTDSTILIQGETGTGKELIADAVHRASKRKNEAFVIVNCAALPSELIESELFGHVKGAFTGATDSREGRFMLADNGTLFLDEIGELSLNLQPKLLRVLQEGTFQPVGSSKTHDVNVRVIAATNRNLLEEVRRGKFREDLYYRLNVFPITVPPLRERGDDVGLLAKYFIEKFSKKYYATFMSLDVQNVNVLKKYHWPGNIRELQNITERALIVSQDGSVDFTSLLATDDGTNKSFIGDIDKTIIYTDNELKELEKQNTIKALNQADWRISGEKGAARLLGIPSTTLNSRMQKYGISK